MTVCSNKLSVFCVKVILYVIMKYLPYVNESESVDCCYVKVNGYTLRESNSASFFFLSSTKVIVKGKNSPVWTSSSKEATKKSQKFKNLYVNSYTVTLLHSEQP